MADTKTERRTTEQEQGRGGAMERRGGGAGLTRRGEWWPQDFLTMNPFSLFRRLSDEMDRAFNTSFGLWGGRGPEAAIWAPPIEVREEKGNLVVYADLPGMNKDEVRVECTQDGLVIEGERKREHEETRAGMHRSERSYGRFYRMIPLPEGADVDKANAQFKDGVLQVRIPMPEEQRKAREIPIST
jgi:HSP20 family protein